MSHTLDSEILNQVRGSLAAMAGSARLLVGLSMSPAVESALRKQLPPPDPRRFEMYPLGCPVIVDPRMTSRSATAYYDRKIWRKRVKEQRRWDRRQSRQNKEIRQRRAVDVDYTTDALRAVACIPLVLIPWSKVPENKSHKVRK